MKTLTKTLAVSAVSLMVFSASAQVASSEKQAARATETRQAVFKLLGANMGPLGGMARGKVPFDAQLAEKHATRINQLSLMIGDYTALDTSKFKTNTEALDKVWTDRASFEKHINDLTDASANLMKVAASGNEGEIKKAIGGVGKTCGGCHDNFKKD
ncbi:c-type cytochrome [Thalassotalea marina]|uniref:Cytochrome c n=1 Tax=Thalassotalea marina TaxID=1673741 RepID=A0A919BN05_9GAMM|nr:cytochrome c [Thalassotalea marina]GHG00287.1 hypothetical protein GCM10017161_31170 [Thalassotalea marina]